LRPEEIQPKLRQEQLRDTNAREYQGEESVDDEKGRYNGNAILAYPRRNNEESDEMIGERNAEKKKQDG